MRKNGQASVEFIILVALLVIIFGFFMKIALDKAYDLRSHKEYLELKDVSSGLKNEIMTAYSVSDGYERQFKMPLVIGEYDYSISLTQGSLDASSGNHQYYLKIPPVTGQPQKGMNTIRKENGIIYLN
ncbi:pilus assembly protein [Candidatus Woesearchaeota archaeon]|nr:pilus assembly protein [Candidatus Woesearchaeota archaeon]